VRTGELLTEVLRRYIVLAWRKMAVGVGTGVDGGIRSAQSMQQMDELMNAGRFGDVLALYSKMPSDLRRGKVAQLRHIAATLAVDSAGCDAAVEEFRRLFPNDPALPLVLLDYRLAGDRLDDALTAVDRIDSFAGGDPYLDFVRADIHVRKHDVSSAGMFARRAIRVDPKIEQPYWTLVDLYMRQKDYPMALKTMTSIATRFSRDVDSMLAARADDFAGLILSEAYRSWKQKGMQPEKKKRPKEPEKP
jgi:tetratricopeptide (TPR) repeat protein